MKKYFFAFILLSVILSSCNLLKQTAENNTTYQEIEKTFTPMQTKTMIPMTLTQNNTLTSTIIPIPTLSEEIINQTIIGLLTDNGCEFPCIFGITPRKKTSDSVKNELTQLKINFFESKDNTISFDYPEKFFGRNEIELNTYNQEITGAFLRLYLQNKNSNWGYYLPINILKKYGQPSEIVFFLDVGNSIVRYRSGITFYYDEIDTVIDYFGYTESNTEEYFMFCPGNYETSSIDVISGDFKKRIPSRIISRSFFNATHVELSDSYQIFLQNPESYCWKVDGSVFLSP